MVRSCANRTLLRFILRGNSMAARSNSLRCNSPHRTITALELMLSSPLAIGALVTSHVDASSTTGATVDGTIGGSEYNGYSYSGASGSGSSFGGALGSGTLFFESDATNLYVGLDCGNLGTNIVAVFLDTKSGGFSNDSTLGDTVDGGRAVASRTNPRRARQFSDRRRLRAGVRKWLYKYVRVEDQFAELHRLQFLQGPADKAAADHARRRLACPHSA